MTLGLAVTFFSWVLAGFSVIATGMGGPLLALPIMAPFVELRVIILVGCFVSVGSNIILTLCFRRDIDWRRAWLTTLPALPGAWAGVLALKFLPSFWLDLFVGLVLVLFVVWSCLSSKEKASTSHESPLAVSGLGFAGGFLTGCAGIGGPPLAICAYNYNWGKNMARGVFGIYFLFGCTVTCLLDLWHGLVTENDWQYIGVGVVAMAIGAAIGIPAGKRISQKLFGRFLLLIILAGALTMLHKALTG